MKRQIQLRVNGEIHEVEVKPHWLLLDVLREELGLTGVKKGCEEGVCGACTILMDGKAVRSCLTLEVRAEGKEILTIEGLSHDGRLHPLQEAFIEQGAVQCGYCTPGMILSAKAFLDETPHPKEDEVKEGISGNICRCTGYTKIVKAILAATGLEDKRDKREEGKKGYAIVGKGSFFTEDLTPLDPDTGQGTRPSEYYKYGAQGVEVEVDMKTGKVEVLKLATAQDVGFAINPLSVEGQIEGGAMMGVGCTLYEEMVLDGGRVVNPSFMDYKVPTVAEAPGEMISII